MKIQVVVFCIVTPCSDVVGYQRFGRPCCPYLQGEVKVEAARSSETGVPTTSLRGVTIWKTITGIFHSFCFGMEMFGNLFISISAISYVGLL
jgi:hypothetical protein